MLAVFPGGLKGGGGGEGREGEGGVGLNTS